MMVKIESCTKDTRTTKGGVLHTGIKANGQWYNIAGDQRNLYGKEVNLEINGQWAKLVKQSAMAITGKSSSDDNQLQIAWEDYIVAVRKAHLVANDLEPDENRTIDGHINRSQARATLVNTMMIALTNGQISLPQTGEPPGTEPL